MFVELCKEDRRLEDRVMCGEFSVSMYCSRSANMELAEMLH